MSDQALALLSGAGGDAREEAAVCHVVVEKYITTVSQTRKTRVVGQTMRKEIEMPNSQQFRGIGVEGIKVPEGAFEDYKIKHALVLGINDYSAGWPPLRTAVKDARAIGRVLQEAYDFDVAYLDNADREGILESLERFRGRTRGERRSLFVFVFAGHGDETGFLIPRDGARDRSKHWINYPDLCYRLHLLGYQHYLILLDCCFSGVITMTRDLIPLPAVPAECVRIDADPAAAVITAGARDERVYDGGPQGHSPFAAAVLDGLEHHLPSGHATLPQSFASYVQMRLLESRTSTPCYADRSLPGDLGGPGRIVIYRKPGSRLESDDEGKSTLLGRVLNELEEMQYKELKETLDELERLQIIEKGE